MPRKRAEAKPKREPVRASLTVQMIHFQASGSPEAIQQALGAVGEALRGLLGSSQEEDPAPAEGEAQ